MATAERNILMEQRNEAKRKASKAREGAEAAEALAAAKLEEIFDAESTLESEKARATKLREAEAGPCTIYVST